MCDSDVAPRPLNTLRLCGPVWAPCGYCKGERSHLASPDRSDDAASSKSYSVLASQLTPALYEQFVGAGWRRSGTALYKPSNFESCCPALAIRLAVDHYRPSKSQAKVDKRMQALLRPKGASTPLTGATPSGRRQRSPTHSSHIEDILDRLGFLEKLREWTESALLQILGDNYAAMNAPKVKYKRQTSAPRDKDAASNVEQKSSTIRVTLYTTVCAAVAGRSKGVVDRETLAEHVVNALLQQKSAIASAELPTSADIAELCAVERDAKSGHVLVHLDVRKPTNGFGGGAVLQFSDDSGCNGNDLDETTTAERANDHATTTESSPSATSAQGEAPNDRLRAWWLSSRQSGPAPAPPYELTVTTLPAHESALDPRVHRLYWVYQRMVHQDPDPFDPTAQLDDSGDTVTSGDDDRDDRWGREHAPAGWREKAVDMLLREYQHEPIDTQARLIKAFASFYEFLVDNPFVVACSRTSSAAAPRKAPLGTYHQHYTLSGGVLVAVGVVDVLPAGLSSVYLFYSPSFARQLAPLGKYAILKEIEWTKWAGIPYYYLGYYIESCAKMNYKGDYHPSDLLCPIANQWVDAKVARAIIQKVDPVHHCCTLIPTVNGVPTDAPAATTDCECSAPGAVHQIPMEVGVGTAVTLGMLHPRGQDLVRPLLQDFLDHAGPEIAVQCSVNFR